MDTDEIDSIAPPTLIFDREDWMKRGACRGTSPALFYAERGEATDTAKAVCATCPIKAECLDFALRNCEMFGVWGGTSERERRQLRRESRYTFTTGPKPCAELEEIARLAIEAIDNGLHPGTVIAMRFGILKRTAMRKVEAARHAGHDIPKTTRRVA
jgi:WhiB family redox-sensing transcriptional regulator